MLGDLRPSTGPGGGLGRLIPWEFNHEARRRRKSAVSGRRRYHKRYMVDEFDQPWPIWALQPVYTGQVPWSDWERFWSYVDKGLDCPHPKGCWLWTAGLGHGGYGKFSYSYNKEKTWSASRFAYFATTGKLPKLFVLHKCDVRRCVRPSHLFEGTPKENSQDMVAKDRQAKGSAHGNSKLTEAKVVAIFEQAAAGGKTQKSIAAEYGVSLALVEKILSKEIWGHVDTSSIQKKFRPWAKITAAIVVEIRERYAKGGETQTSLAKVFGVSKSLVGFIVRREIWGHVP